MSEPSIQQTLGIPSDVHYEGKIFKFGPANQGLLAEQEKAFVSLAREMLKATTDPKDLPEEMEAHRDRVARRHYAAGSPGWIQMLMSPDGWDVVYLTMLRVNHPDMTMELVRKIGEESKNELLDAAAEQLPDFFAKAFRTKNPMDVRKVTDQLVAALKAQKTCDPPVSNGMAL